MFMSILYTVYIIIYSKCQNQFKGEADRKLKTQQNLLRPLQRHEHHRIQRWENQVNTKKSF